MVTKKVLITKLQKGKYSDYGVSLGEFVCETKEEAYNMLIKLNKQESIPPIENLIFTYHWDYPYVPDVFVSLFEIAEN